MKKLVSLFIVAVMLMSLCSISAFAQAGDYCDYYDRFVAEYGETYLYDELFVSFGENGPSYYVVYAQLEFACVDPPEHIEEMGIINSDLVFTQIPFKNPFLVGYAVYDVADDKYYDITKVNINEYDGLYDYLVENNIASMIGDVDYDKKISVMDATALQRILANITNLKNNKISDYNRDDSVDIIDVTAIQKYIANLAPDIPTVNTELVYAPYNDDFNISGGVTDIKYTSVYNGQLEYGDHYMDCNDFAVIIKSKEQYNAVFNFDNGKYDDEFFATKSLVATVRIVTDYYMTKTIGYVGVYDNTMVLINNTYTGGSGNIALPMAPPYVSIVEVDKQDLAYVDEIVWVPVK